MADLDNMRPPACGGPPATADGRRGADLAAATLAPSREGALASSSPRYALQAEAVGWSVIDARIGGPAAVDGRTLTGLPLAQAEILAALLSWPAPRARIARRAGRAD